MRWIAPILLVCSLFVLFSPTSVAAKTLSYPGLTFHKETTPQTSHTLKLIFGLFKQSESLLISHDAPIPTKMAKLLPLPSISDESVPQNLKENVVLLAKKPTPTVIPTETPTPTPTISDVPLSPSTPLPTDTPTPTSQPITTSSMPANPTGGLNADKLFAMVNNYRNSKGLASFQTDPRACQLATERASEVGEEIANNHMHSGLKARNLPYWNTENIISYNSEEGAFNWWINDTIHREQIEGNFTYSCMACNGNNCAEEFTNFVAK